MNVNADMNTKKKEYLTDMNTHGFFESMRERENEIKNRIEKKREEELNCDAIPR